MATNPRELSSVDTEAYLHAKTQARAGELLRDFCRKFISPEMEIASDLYADYRGGALGEQKAREQLTELSPKEYKQVWGMATDFPVMAQFIDDSLVPEPTTEHKWATEAPIKCVDSLLQAGENVNLETILIQAVHNLAIMEVYDGQSDIVYDAIVKAESVYAPLCEIIGYDSPAMALRSKAACIRLRNSSLDHIVNESERISLMYQDERGDYGPRFHHFASRILQETTGSSNLEPVIGSDSKHGIVLEEGFNNAKGLREVARLKTVGSRANKLHRSTLEYDGDIEVNMDDVGVTIVAQDDAHLIASYIDAVHAMLNSEHITPWPSPRRDEPFHIRGSAEFVGQLKAALAEHFDADMFEFVADDTGFHVAKMTGYYEDNTGCVPFEVQFLTQEGRKDSRVGKAAHIFFKIMRNLGHRYVPTEDEIKRTAKLNTRRAHIGSSDLCPASEERFADFMDHLAA